MPAYCVFIYKNLHDRSKMLEYWANARNSLAAYNVKMLSGYNQFEVMEGDDPVKAIAIAEFESMADAKAWYNSPGYAPYRKLRMEAADFLTIFVEGGAVPVEQRFVDGP
jgi:uncharacterized protein (DUF1330 family)